MTLWAVDLVGMLLRVIVSLLGLGRPHRVLLRVVRLVVHHVLRDLMCLVLLVLLEADIAKIGCCLDIRHRIVVLHGEVGLAPETLGGKLLWL